MFYIKKKLYKQYYFLLLIIIPILLLTRTKTNAIISVILLIIITLCLVSTRWSIKLKKFFQYKLVSIPDFNTELYIFYNNKILKVNKNRTFIYLNEIFYIKTIKEEGMVASNKEGIYSLINNNSLMYKGYKIEKVYIDTNKMIEEMFSFNYLNEDILIPKAIEKYLYNCLGKNIQEIPKPQFLDILIDHLLSPFFLLTIFSSILWLFDDYFFTTITNLCLSIFIEISNAYQKYSNLCLFSKKDETSINFQFIDSKKGGDVLGDEKIPEEMSLINEEEKINDNLLNVLEMTTELTNKSINKKIDTNIDDNNNHLHKLLYSQPTLIKNSRDLKPGDVINITETDIINIKKFPCDFLLLSGTIIVNESLLTGESIPISKVPIFSINNNNDYYNELKGKEIKNLKQSTIFGGSTLILTSNSRLMVLNIGFSTESGKLISKMILKDNVNINYKDSAIFIILLIFIGFLGCYYLIKQYFLNEKFKSILFSNEKLNKFCIENIYKVPNLKKILSKLIEKKKEDIINELERSLLDNISNCSCYYILKEFQIKKFYPKFNDIIIDILMLLTNIVPCELPLELSMSINSCVSQLLTNKIYVVEPSKLENAGDIDIICLDKTGTITEDSLIIKGIWLSNKEDERSIEVLSACHDLISINNELLGDPIDKAISEHLETKIMNNITKYENKSIEILKRYQFTSEKKTQSCLILIDDKMYYVMKGAREEILKRCDLNNINNDEEIYEQQSSLGLRILSFCYKEVNRIDIIDNKDMKYSGLILMENPIKQSCIEEINILKNEGYKVIMITGDSQLTSKSIAIKVGIINEDSNIETNLIDGEDIIKLLRVSNLCKNVLKDIKVFSRVSPKMKEEIIKSYQSIGLNCMMIGDGTNDVGALKEAKVGISLLQQIEIKKEKEIKKTIEEIQEEKITELKAKLGLLSLNENESNMIGDASIAAPISTRYGLKTISIILSYGRSLKITNLQMYKILSINSVIFAGFWILDSKNIIFGDKQMVFTSFLMSIAFMTLTLQNPVKLENKRNKPIKAPKIRSLYTFFTILLQIIIHIITFYYSLKIFDTQPTLLKQMKLLKDIKSICSINNKEAIELITDTIFKPTRLNTIFFILTQYLQIQTFLINYIGRPFRENLIENKKLFLSLILCIVFLLSILFNINDDLNGLVECINIDWCDIKLLIKIMGCNGLLCLLVDRVGLYLVNL